MKDRDFLIWLHERLIFVHGEDVNYDYMHALRAIINKTPIDQLSFNELVDVNDIPELVHITNTHGKQTHN